MKAYLLDDHDGGKVWIAFGADPVEASQALTKIIGGEYRDGRYSVSGSWDVEPGTAICVSKFWMYFTANPPQRHVRA